MKANPYLMQMKYARIVEEFARISGLSLGEALCFFYHSNEYKLISKGISDLHCMSDGYLAEDLKAEYDSKRLS